MATAGFRNTMPEWDYRPLAWISVDMAREKVAIACLRNTMSERDCRPLARYSLQMAGEKVASMFDQKLAKIHRQSQSIYWQLELDRNPLYQECFEK